MLDKTPPGAALIESPMVDAGMVCSMSAYLIIVQAHRIETLSMYNQDLSWTTEAKRYAQPECTLYVQLTKNSSISCIENFGIKAQIALSGQWAYMNRW